MSNIPQGLSQKELTSGGERTVMKMGVMIQKVKKKKKEEDSLYHFPLIILEIVALP